MIAPLLPELFLLASTLILLMFGAFAGNRSTPAVATGAVLALAFAAFMLSLSMNERDVLLGGMVLVDGFTQFSKLLVLVGAIAALLLSSDWLAREEHARFEFPVLILTATLGLMCMISAHNLIALYMGLELASLSLYVLAAFHRDDLKSSEAGLKYFVLGALASGMLLFGMSLIYGFSGTTDFATLGALFTRTQATALAHPEAAQLIVSPGVTVGLILVIVGLSFKIAAAPFHMWAPDVYEGAPTPVVAFFASAPKIAAMVLFIRVLMQPFLPLVDQWQQIIVVIAILSMAVGALGALWQTNIKRLLAYSSIGHVGYALVGLAAASPSGVQGVLVYLSLYLFMTAGAFGCVLMMRRHGDHVESLEELSGLSKTHPKLALTLAILMFSMAGIPPLAGFFGKFFVFKAALESGLFALAIIGVLTSVVACYYYLKIVKLMYFDEAREPFDKGMTYAAGAVMMISVLVTLAFALAPGALLTLTQSAASALFL